MSLPAKQAAAPERVDLTAEQMEAFLLTAKIVSTKGAGGGVTGSSRATLSDGRLTHDAHIQAVNEARAIVRTRMFSEVDFKDTYANNIAGYRLARLLNLDNVPMSVERKVDGKPAAVTWWIDAYSWRKGNGGRPMRRDRFPDA